MDSLRQIASARLYEIGQNSRLKTPEKAAGLRDAFVSLDLAADPVGLSLSRCVEQLAGSWAGDNPERIRDLYTTGLTLAACALGGPAGAGLAQVSDWRALSHLSDLASEAGTDCRELLEAMVPASWQDGTGLDTPDEELYRQRWQLGQQLTLLQAQRPDLQNELGYLREYRMGQPISAADAERNVRQRVIFGHRYREQGWAEQTGAQPASLQDQYVAILAPVDGELREYRGRVTDTREGYTHFKLAEIPDMTFSGNTVVVLMTRAF